MAKRDAITSCPASDDCWTWCPRESALCPWSPNPVAISNIDSHNFINPTMISSCTLPPRRGQPERSAARERWVGTYWLGWSQGKIVFLVGETKERERRSCVCWDSQMFTILVFFWLSGGPTFLLPLFRRWRSPGPLCGATLSEKISPKIWLSGTFSTYKLFFVYLFRAYWKSM